MDFFEVINKRCSIRRFSNEPIPDEHLTKILAAAIRAPSSNNSQPWHFVVIKNKALLTRMAQAVAKKIDEILSWPEAKGQEARIEAYRPLYTFFDQAPVVIAVFGCDVSSLIGGIFTQRGLKRRVSSAQQSVAAAIENLLLAAQALGYGACWMTGPLIAAEELESLINLGNPWYLVALVPIGKPTEKPSPRRRKPLSEVVSYR